MRLPNPVPSFTGLIAGVLLLTAVEGLVLPGHCLAAETSKSAQPMPRNRPRETYVDLDVRYETATTPTGAAVSMIVTQPKAGGRLPTIVFMPWLSCDAVDYPKGAVDGWSRVLLELAHTSGMTLVRVEKPGLGDSSGPACSDSDLNDDMAGFRAALRDVGRLPQVDASRVFLFGGSIGAALVPILARELPVRGIIASGGFYKTWLEHMLEIERRRLVFDGQAPAQVTAAMRGFADLYSRYLNGGQTPGQVIEQRPDLKPIWYDKPDHQYGRAARYYQQVQALDVAGAWADVKAPVLVLYGQYDWIMSRDDQDLIIDTANRTKPGRARLVVVPRMGHNLEVFDSPQRAYAEQGAQPATSVAPEILRFVKETLAQPPG